MLPGDCLLLLGCRNSPSVRETINSREAVAFHKTSAELSCTVLRNGQEIELSISKPSKDAALGIVHGAGLNVDAVKAIAAVLPSSLTHLRCVQHIAL